MTCPVSIDKNYEIKDYRFRPGTCGRRRREERTIETVSFRNKVVCTFFTYRNSIELMIAPVRIFPSPLSLSLSLSVGTPSTFWQL